MNERKISCPRPNSKCKHNQKNTETLLILKKPFPQLMIFDLNWSMDDITPVQCLNILASLPPYYFVPNVYNVESLYDPLIYMSLYKLKSIICYTGQHYLTFIRVKSSLSLRKSRWTLFNDDKVQLFPNWYEVVDYLVQTQCCPTILIYEYKLLPQPMNLQEINATSTMLTYEELLMLYLQANQGREDMMDLCNDEELMKEQEEILLEAKKSM